MDAPAYGETRDEEGDGVSRDVLARTSFFELLFV